MRFAVTRALTLAGVLAACDDGGPNPELDQGVVRVRPLGGLGIDVDGPCRFDVFLAGAQGTLRVRTPAPEGTAVEARVVDGPGVLLAGERPTRMVDGGEARFTFGCDGFGVTHVFARDAQGRTAVSGEILCARPSAYAAACASNVQPVPAGDWTVEQIAPTGVLGRRLAPRGRPAPGLPDAVLVKLRLVFASGRRPETGGAVGVTVSGDAPEGVEVEPDRVGTEAGTGEAGVMLRAGPASGSFTLTYTATLDGETRIVDSLPFVVVRPPADAVRLSCVGGLTPRPWFDATGRVLQGGLGARCLLEAFADGGAPLEGTRAWALTEAGTTSRRLRHLEADGTASFYVDAGRPPPVDAAPPGPSPLDGIATVVGIVEGAERFEDRDGDGVFTAGVDAFDPAFDVAEPFIDADDDGRYGAGETFFDTDGDGAWTPANGRPDAVVLRWASARLRWVGPVANDAGAMTLDCAPPDCQPEPVPGVHDGLCPDGADAWLGEDAVVPGRARFADANGQCVGEGGATAWFVEPAGAVIVEGSPPPRGPCGVGGATEVPFTLRLKRAAAGPVHVGVRDAEGGEVWRTLCAP